MSRSPRTLAWRLGRIGIAVVVAWKFALPQLRLVPAAVAALAAAPPLLLAAVGLCAVVALLAYAQLTRTMLGAGPRPGLLHTFGIITTSLGISNVVPAGAAAGGVVAFRMLERAGVGKARAGAAMAATSLGSTAVLNLLLAAGLIALLPVHGGLTGAIAALPSLLVVGSGAAGARALLRRTGALWGAASWLDERQVPVVRRWRLVHGLDGAALVVQSWADQPKVMLQGLFWAVVNWVVDVLALWLTLLMVGVTVSPLLVLVAFALANLAAVVPLTPGGVGVVELTITATLVGLGAPAAQTAVGVAAYRVFTYWLPIPGSALAYAFTRVHERRRIGGRVALPASAGGR